MIASCYWTVSGSKKEELNLHNASDLLFDSCYITEISEGKYVATNKEGFTFNSLIHDSVYKKFIAIYKNKIVTIYDFCTGCKVKSYDFNKNAGIPLLDCVKEAVAKFSTDTKLLDNYYVYTTSKMYRIFEELSINTVSGMSIIKCHENEIWQEG